MKIRIPAPSDLRTEPVRVSLLLLDFAAALADNSLRAAHVQIEGDFYPDEAAEVTTARVLARECEMLRDTLREYRHRVHTRLDRERCSDDPCY